MDRPENKASQRRQPEKTAREDSKIKAACRCGPSRVVSICQHIGSDGAVTALCETPRRRPERYQSQASVLPRALGTMFGYDRMEGRCRTNGVPSRLALRARLRRLAALTGLRWPGSLLAVR